MPGTFTRLLYHIIFSTQRRANLIAAELQPRLNEYLGGTIRSERGISHEIDGVADHVHLLIQWRTDVALSTRMRRLKANSSRFPPRGVSDDGRVRLAGRVRGVHREPVAI